MEELSMKKEKYTDLKDQQEEQNHDNSGFHVLAVDDSLIDRKMLEKLLTLSSYHVTCVESGDKALEYLGLVDHSPHIDQDHDADDDHHDSTIHHSHPSADDPHHQDGSFRKDVPVVVMSSENVPSRIHMCLEEGAEEFLLKPVRLSDLKKLHPHILKSTTTTTTASHSCEETNNAIGAGSSCNLMVNRNANYDYEEDIISDDKGQGKLNQTQMD
ncbi:hypothetical protein Cgig2_004754 [Carnegiea gigantea]|uniref:Response regulatory domain-containing protein n=1 Tax=Carnegiea gigantea TaxID=171969 RepID=A0A9Q1QPZ6_9CARY|nr:hypothetical protein Cgig2_004754 [Carnegiea gigantea]